MEKLTIYMAMDGKVFTDRKKAKAYEEKLLKDKEEETKEKDIKENAPKRHIEDADLLVFIEAPGYKAIDFYKAEPSIKDTRRLIPIGRIFTNAIKKDVAENMDESEEERKNLAYLMEQEGHAEELMHELIEEFPDKDIRIMDSDSYNEYLSENLIKKGIPYVYRYCGYTYYTGKKSHSLRYSSDKIKKLLQSDNETSPDDTFYDAFALLLELRTRMGVIDEKKYSKCLNEDLNTEKVQ